MSAFDARDLLDCYARGVFPMADAREDARVFLIDPERRGVIPLDRFHVPKRLARTVRADRFEIRVDTAFHEVVLACAAWGGLLFLHLPFAIIILYAFTTDEATYSFPPPGLTLNWFSVAAGRTDFWQALFLSLRVAGISTLVALVLGTLAAAAVSRSRFFGRDAVSFLLVLPIALPGIVTGIALRSALGLLEIPFSFWTIVIGHANGRGLALSH